MTKLQRIVVMTLSAALAAGTLIPPMLRAAAPAGKAAAAKTRSPSDIMNDLQKVQVDVTKIMAPTPELLTIPAFRNGDGQKILPLLKKMVALLDEMEHSEIDADSAQDAKSSRYLLMSYTTALGDKDSEAKLLAGRQLKGEDAVAPSAYYLMSQWFLTAKDPAAQQKLLDEITPLAKAYPKSSDLVNVMGAMSQVGAASPDISKKVIAAVRANLDPVISKQLVTMAEASEAQQQMVGKPLAFGGRTTTAASFNTAEYKGKVVLVDFWATWCGPCIAGLPEVKKIYETYHAMGLEIVGVDCDTTDSVVNRFTEENKMPWVQLRESSQTGSEQWHPLAKQYQVLGIPQMFLIDRQGVLRYIDARGDMEKKVKELLAETDKPAAPK